MQQRKTKANGLIIRKTSSALHEGQKNLMRKMHKEGLLDAQCFTYRIKMEVADENTYSCKLYHRNYSGEWKLTGVCTIEFGGGA